MRALLTSLLIIGLSAECACGADRVDELFVSWQAAQRDIKSLLVEFTKETLDRSSDKLEEAEGTFRLIRNPDGKLLASYRVIEPRTTREKRPSQVTGLLAGGAIYLLDHRGNSALRFDLKEDALPPFLEKYFNPFVLLLDQQRAQEKCRFEVVKQDERYTYLDVKPKLVTRSGWFQDSFDRGQVIVMNNDSDEVPKEIPWGLRYWVGTYQFTFYIKSWRLNADQQPQPEEFTRPEDRPGWKVYP
jgi:hypothetical protein